MFSIANLKVRTRLAFGFGVVLLLLAGVTFVGITRMGSMDDNTDLIVMDRYPKTVLLYGIQEKLNEVARSMRNIIIFGDPEQVRSELGMIDGARRSIKESIDKIEKMITTERGKEDFKAVLEARGKFVAMEDEFEKLVQAGKKEEARSLLLTKARPLQLAYMDVLGGMIKYQLITFLPRQMKMG